MTFSKISYEGGFWLIALFMGRSSFDTSCKNPLKKVVLFWQSFIKIFDFSTYHLVLALKMWQEREKVGKSSFLSIDRFYFGYLSETEWLQTCLGMSLQTQCAENNLDSKSFFTIRSFIELLFVSIVESLFLITVVPNEYGYYNLMDRG